MFVLDQSEDGKKKTNFFENIHELKCNITHFFYQGGGSDSYRLPSYIGVKALKKKGWDSSYNIVHFINGIGFERHGEIFPLNTFLNTYINKRENYLIVFASGRRSGGLCGLWRFGLKNKYIFPCIVLFYMR